jgi:2,4-dienoyl-CoA reductase-like NADH-dependent reductase (Old Yellow Enzyme family)
MYSKPNKIGSIEIKNRFVRSATYEGMATDDGEITDKLVQLYKALAEGGVGLIITGYAYVQQSGKANNGQTGVDKDDLIVGLSKIPKVIHENGNRCKVALQIVHCGRQSRFIEETLAPSAVFEPNIKKMPREMTIDEIHETVDSFAEAILRAKKANFDAVQLHGAHGYLLSQFLSPYTNGRTDDYGGSTENRIRIVEEIYKKGVELVGEDFPILIKMNADDLLGEVGITISESKKIAEILSKLGFAAIEISSGMFESSSSEKIREINKDKRKQKAYHLPYAKEIIKLIDIPLILVGAINSLDLANNILNEGSADFISMCRPFIREPDFPNRWLSGDGEPTVTCRYCGKCLAEGSIQCNNMDQK